jgi:hypothetical protein
MSAGWAAAGAAAGSVLGAGISAGANAMISKRQRRWAELQADKQYSRQIEQRDYANWYNSPENQRQLLIDAGMNPNLAYGGSFSSGQGSMPRPEQAKGEFPKIPMINLDPIGKMLQYQGFKKSIAETDKVTEEVNKQRILNDILQQTKGTLIDKRQAELDLLRSKATTEAEKRRVMDSQILLNAERQRYQKEIADMAEDRVFPGDNPFIRLIQGMGDKGKDIWNQFIDYMLNPPQPQYPSIIIQKD